MARVLPKKDVVIIGLGWTGSILAQQLTDAGLNVVAIERGPWRDTPTDFNIAYDDSAILGAFRLNPYVLWHVRFDGTPGQKSGSLISTGVAPGLPIGGEGVYAFFPVGVAFFLTEQFKGGNKTGYAYSYFGASLGVPLSLVWTPLASWRVLLNTTYYSTDRNALPFNATQNFITGSVGLTTST